MKQVLLFLFVITFFSCGSSNEKSVPGENGPGVTKSKEASTALPKVGASVFNALLDSVSVDSKEIRLKDANVNEASWVDAYCPTCNTRCCSPCFAGASRQCAYLKFQNCSVCNHSSNGHYAVAH